MQALQTMKQALALQSLNQLHKYLYAPFCFLRKLGYNRISEVPSGAFSGLKYLGFLYVDIQMCENTRQLCQLYLFKQGSLFSNRLIRVGALRNINKQGYTSVNLILQYLIYNTDSLVMGAWIEIVCPYLKLVSVCELARNRNALFNRLCRVAQILT